MKRSSLKRGASKLRRTPLAKRGKRAEREADVLREFRAAVLRGCYIPQRGFVCARCDDDFFAHQIDAHHIKPRSRGGAHISENGAALCRKCHGEVHARIEPWKEWIR